jgi:hypothetical protein
MALFIMQIFPTYDLKATAQKIGEAVLPAAANEQLPHLALIRLTHHYLAGKQRIHPSKG